MWIIFKLFVEFVTVLCFGVLAIKHVRSPTGDQTLTPCVGRESPNHRTTGEGPLLALSSPGNLPGGRSSVPGTSSRDSPVHFLLILLSFSRLVVSDSLRPHGLQPTRLLCPWDFPGKNTGVGCHFLLRYTSYYFTTTLFFTCHN